MLLGMTRELGQETPLLRNVAQFACTVLEQCLTGAGGKAPDAKRDDPLVRPRLDELLKLILLFRHRVVLLGRRQWEISPRRIRLLEEISSAKHRIENCNDPYGNGAL